MWAVGPETREALTIPRFVDAEARDRAYAEWVADGNALVNGMRCAVALGRELCVYRDGEWRPGAGPDAVGP